MIISLPSLGLCGARSRSSQGNLGLFAVFPGFCLKNSHAYGIIPT